MLSIKYGEILILVRYLLFSFELPQFLFSYTDVQLFRELLQKSKDSFYVVLNLPYDYLIYTKNECVTRPNENH